MYIDFVLPSTSAKYRPGVHVRFHRVLFEKHMRSGGMEK